MTPGAIRILTLTTLFPNAARPEHGVFVETRLRHLVDSGEVRAEVVAPIPFFPITRRFFARLRQDEAAPDLETRVGLRVHHPRYPLVPKVSMHAAPFILARCARARVEEIMRAGGDFDAIDAHFFYPDGVAAALVGRALGKPVVITARGTDVNLTPKHPGPRRMIQWAGGIAAGVVAVCAALKERLIELGISADKIRVLRNGVDLERFRPIDRAHARARFALDGPALASVGQLIPRKGHDLVIRALRHLPNHTLLIAGAGPEERTLRMLAHREGLADRVRFLGTVPQEGLRDVYNAVDILVLASSREGWANVLLEAMACGTPAVASRVWGTPEVVAEPPAGQLFDARTPEAIAVAVQEVTARGIDRAATRTYAERFSWAETTQGQIALFREAVSAAQAMRR